MLDVKCAVEYMSFSAHADAKGILQVIRQCKPANVMLVHGEKSKMYRPPSFHLCNTTWLHFLFVGVFERLLVDCSRDFLKQKIRRDFGIPCYNPPNHTSITVKTKESIPVNISIKLLKRRVVGSGLPAFAGVH